MKNSWLKFKIFILVNILYNIAYRLYNNSWCSNLIINILNIKNLELRNFVSLEELLLKKDSIDLFSAQEILMSYSEPIFNVEKFRYSPLFHSEIHKQYFTVLKDATIIGESNLILIEKKYGFYNLNQYNSNDRYKYTDIGIKFSKKDKFFTNNTGIQNEINEAIYLGGNFSWNFYHFFYEILTKFEKINDLDDAIPLILDKKCFETLQYFELVTYLDKKNRNIIVIDKGEMFKINRLYYFSPPNFIPPDFINENKILANDVLLNTKSLEYLKNNLMQFSSARKFPMKIYLSRANASGRRKFNEEEIINLVKNFGFVVVFPEKYSIQEQIAMFNQADIIIGGSGAAFTNLLFCKRNCRVIIFAKNNLPFSGFSTVASFVGAELIYLTENNLYGQKNNSIHDPFKINLDNLINILNTIDK